MAAVGKAAFSYMHSTAALNTTAIGAPKPSKPTAGVASEHYSTRHTDHNFPIVDLRIESSIVKVQVAESIVQFAYNLYLMLSIGMTALPARFGLQSINDRYTLHFSLHLYFNNNAVRFTSVRVQNIRGIYSYDLFCGDKTFFI